MILLFCSNDRVDCSTGENTLLSSIVRSSASIAGLASSSSSLKALLAVMWAIHTNVNLSGGLRSLLEGVRVGVGVVRVRVGVGVGRWIEGVSVGESLCGSVTFVGSRSGMSCMPFPVRSAGIMLCELRVVSGGGVVSPSPDCVSYVDSGA